MSTTGRGRVVGSLNHAVIGVLNGLISDRKLTHPALSEFSGIPRSTLSKLLAGKSVLDLGQLSSVCATLKVPVHKVLKEAEEAANSLEAEGSAPDERVRGSQRLSVVIADILSATAKERGISQSKLAAKSGVSQAQISRIFGYKRSVSLEDLFLIAEALDRPAREIVAIVEADLDQQKERKVEEAASALDAEEAANAGGANGSTPEVDAPDAAGVLRRLSVVDGGHAASARRGHVPSLSEIEQASGNMA